MNLHYYSAERPSRGAGDEQHVSRAIFVKCQEALHRRTCVCTISLEKFLRIAKNNLHNYLTIDVAVEQTIKRNARRVLEKLEAA